MNDTAHYLATSTPTPLPKPRKLPKQGRSRILVQSLKQACLQILQNEGQQALTATRIASVSGVAMGSLYQYFPNVDAIVASTYEDLLKTQGEPFDSYNPTPPNRPPTPRNAYPSGRSELIDCLLKLSHAGRDTTTEADR